MSKRPPGHGPHKPMAPNSQVVSSSRQAPSNLAEQYDRDKRNIISSCFSKLEKGIRK